MGRQLTRGEVIKQFREVHGNDYDYTKFVYVNNKTKGIIICPNHGEFSQQPSEHKRGKGCLRCKVECQTLSQYEVIQHFLDKHGDFYDYTKFVYVNARTKGIIICPHHGEFLQSPWNHRGGGGCPKCARNQILSQDEVIKQFREVHGNDYDYSKFVYVGSGIKGIIICPHHGEFLQTRINHKRGTGCPQCAHNKLLSQDEAIQNFRSVHGNDYDYSKFVYVNNKTKGIIICPHHGEFLQSPNLHKQGNGCPQCAYESKKGGYDSLSPKQRTKIKDVYLYHLELQYGETIFHKVGITGNPPVRFSKIQRESKSTILNGRIHMYQNAEIAFNLEQKILDHMMFDRSEKYHHPIHFGGHSECFLPVPNPQGWNLDLNNIPPKSPRFNYNDAFE